ncbi:MAG: glycoside hydrolase family 92 protein, partial [Saccharothrix sp.]|nr:glycoside hydrolase family 92 protein [Saccharothrix sp.]
VSASAPDGWSVTAPRQLVVESDRLPAQRTVEVVVTVPAGAPIGRHPVRVTVSGPNTVVREAVVEVRRAATCAVAGEQCAVDLSGELDHDGTATVGASAEGDFDGQGWSYDAALLPAAGPVVLGGVTYQAPDPTGTAANFVEARGQALLLPAGEHGALRLVAASHNGPVSAAVTVRYADGSTAEVPVVVGDWAGAGGTVALEMPHRIKRGQGVDGPPVRLFALTLPLDPARTVHSVTLPDDPRVEVYAITLT